MVKKRRHLIGDAIRGLERATMEHPGFEIWMIFPNLYRQGEKPRVGTLEFVETLHVIAEHDELEGGLHIHGVFDDELEIEEGHVLCLVNYYNILFWNMDARCCIVRQNVADAGVRVGGRIVIFHGKTVIGVDVQIGDVKLFSFFFNFVPQHGVVCELYEFSGNEFGSDRENGGGFTGTCHGIHDGIMPGFSVI